MQKILIIDDEPQIQKFLKISLNSQNYEVISAQTGRTGIQQARYCQPNLVILDLGLPDIDGKHVLQVLVGELRLNVLVLSVRDGEAEKVSCLNMGAVDYVVKPFGVNELLARMRRIFTLTNETSKGHSLTYQDAHLKINESTRIVKLDDEVVSLTRKEWAVLLQLLEANGNMVTHTKLLHSIWGPSHFQDTHYLRNVIQKLRQKLKDDAANPHYIETEPGVGYRFISARTLS